MLKFLKSFFLSLILVPGLFAGDFKSFTGKVTGDKVRIRNAPDLDSSVISQVNKDALLLVVGEKNDYFIVKPLDSIKGYVYRTYLIDKVVEANKINIRLKPDLESPVIGQFYNKDRVEGELYKGDNKWMEVDLPESTNFYISKEYIKCAGDANFYHLMAERKEEVNNLLNSAFFLTQAECKKDYSEMSLKQAVSQFEAIIKGYTDFSEQVKQAKEGLALLQDTFLQKKIAYLESKGIETQERQEILKEMPTLQKKQVSNKGFICVKNLNTKMKNWVCVEEKQYLSWNTFHPNKSIGDFYEEQMANAIKIKGRIEAFNEEVKNKPGDYVLKAKSGIFGFLYSINVNLEEYVNKEICLLVSPRPNNNFAFPAYFVNAIEEGN